jgi:cell division protease FtsH
MRQFYKNIFWALLSLVALSLIFSFFLSPRQNTENLSLNQLAAKINAGEVQKITAQGQNLAIELKDGSKAVSQKETETGITDTLKNFGVNPAALQQVDIEVENQSGFQFWASLLLPTLLPLLIIGFIFWLMFRQAKGGVNQAFTFGQSRIRLNAPGKEDRTTFKDVAGLKEAKEELIEIVDFLKNPKKFFDLGAKIPRGVLLMGPPGTGKTLLARAVAGEAHVPFFSISASEFVEMFVGVGASRTRDAFLTAKKAAPSILFIDEIDAIGRQRGGFSTGNEEREQTLNQILVELDGFDRDTRVIVLAATNRPDILDQALLRPGRFDRHVMLDLPDINDREAILKIHSRDKSFAPDVDLRKIATRTPGFAGADLANLMNEGAILAARGGKKQIEQIDLYSSIEKVILGPERRGRTISKHEKEITAYHEGGHALVAASLKNTDPVHKVSIVSRGMAGGYTMKLPLEERRLKTKNQFLADMAVMLGGFVSEKLTFGDVSTGASSDLKEASELARKLVTRYGMSEKLGPMTFGKSEELMFMGKELSSEKNYSEDTAQKIDGEVSSFIQRAQETAIEILKKHKRALKKIADVLIEKETLEQEEFVALLKPYKIRPVAVRV